MGAHLDIDDVCADHPVAKAELERLRAIEAAQQRIAALESDLETERARGIHTCHDQCERPLCVAQRRIAELEGVGQCICPKCGIRHGSSNTDGGF